jgi:integrase
MIRLYRRKEGGNWQASFWHNGKEVRFSCKTTHKREAYSYAQTIEGEMTGAQLEVNPRTVSFEMVTDHYLEHIKRTGQQASLPAIKSRIRALLRVFGPGYQVRKLSTYALVKYQATRSEQVAPATVNVELTQLNAILRYAASIGLIASVPLKPKPLAGARVRQGFFEYDEYLAIKAELPDDYQDVLDFAYVSGWRRTAIWGLTWAEVDLKASEIRLDPRRSKNKETVILPIMATMRDVLERRWTKREKNMLLVFHFDGRYIDRKHWYRAWEKACKAASFPGKHLHDMRRTVVRNLTRLGVPESTVMKWTGHKTRAVFNRYNIVDQRDLKNAAEKLDEFMSGQRPKVRRFV